MSLIDQLAGSQSDTRPVAFRIGLYEAIRRAAVAQHDAVRADDLDRFYNLLQDRERLLEKAENVHQELDSTDQARAGYLVRDILRVDQETERLLVSRIDDAREDLGGITVGRQALSAYGRAAELRG